MSFSRVRNIVFPFLIISSILFPFIFIDKGLFVLAINKLHGNILDIVFRLLSALGNGLTIAICAIFLLKKYKLRYFYEFALAFFIQLAIVSLFKRVLFAHAYRPYKYFSVLNQEHLLSTVDGVHLNLFNSFPSGHTATIFLIVTFFALLYNNRKTTWVLFGIAFFVGLSRVYLVQHFYIDVYFGLLFGTGSALLAHSIVSKSNHSRYNKRANFDFNSKKKSAMNV